MRNTGTEYLSTERQPIVLEKLTALLPPLSEEQRCALEADILRNGCYAPVIVNEDLTVIDGHNRLSICREHDIPYRMAVFAFDDLLDGGYPDAADILSHCETECSLRPAFDAHMGLSRRKELDGGGKMDAKMMST